LDVAIAANGSYTVSVDGAPWFESDDTFITSGGTVYSLSAGTLALERTAKSTGMDGLGAFAQTTMMLRAGSTPPQTVAFSIKAWEDGETLEFTQSFRAYTTKQPPFCLRFQASSGFIDRVGGRVL